MRLCTVSTAEIPAFFGIDLGKRILRVAQAGAAFGLSDADLARVASTKAYFENLPQSEKILRRILKGITETPKAVGRPAADGHPHLLNAADVTHLPPIERPGKILCIGLNYRDHCEEQNKEIPKKPMAFNKFATSLRGHGAEITLPHKVDKNIDFEAELAVIIGKTARRVTKRTALKHVGGYTIMNDVSARTLQANEKQWSRAKGFDGSGPCGPIIVTPDEIPDPHALAISCHVNGKKMQDSNTSNLIFNIPELISWVSQMITLEPGDMISTGTPGGVGVYRNPPVFLASGDIVEVKIDRIGTLRNTFVSG